MNFTDSLAEVGKPGDTVLRRPQHISMHVGFEEIEQFPQYQHISNGDLFCLKLSNNTATLTHPLHRFPAKFIPPIPLWAISEFATRASTILDPFMGSGTTLVQGLTAVRKSLGIDIDPLARLIARAKIGVPSSSRIAKLAEHLRLAWTGPAAKCEVPMGGLVNFRHWFSDHAWGHLQSLLSCILELESNNAERDFFLGVFSSIIRWVSNADDQTQKTYVSGTLRKVSPPVPATFWRAFERAAAGLRELEVARLEDSEAEVLDGTAADTRVPDNSVNLIVTSPPYLDSVDYMYNFMLEYFWLGSLIGVPTREIFNRMRRITIGAKNPASSSRELAPSITDLIRPEDIPEPRVRAACAYCAGMAHHFREAYRVLHTGGRYVLVIGNSQSGKGILPVHDCLIRLAVDAGLSFEKAFGYRIRRHYMKFPRKGRGGIILMDWVIVLRKATRPGKYPKRLPLPWFTLGDDDVAH
jgi:hypothetical protein